MANCMAKIAECLGVKLDEVFRIEDFDLELYDFFKITEKGLYISSKSEPYDWKPAPNFMLLLTGEIEITKLPQKPKKPAIGDMYCYPDSATPILWGRCSWRGDEVDDYRFHHGFVFTTREEAIAATEEMINNLPKEEWVKTNG